MKNKTEIKIFLASPGDTLNERNFCESCIKEWNSLMGVHKDIILDIVRWEKDLSTKSGIAPQEHINKTLLDKSDILIGIFWSRFGYPTKTALSPTAGEIGDFLSKGKPVIMYFSEKLIKPTDIDPKEQRKIETFKKKYKSQNVYKYVNPENENQFREIILRDISENVTDLIEKREAKNSENIPYVAGSDVAKKEQKAFWYEKSIKEMIEAKLAEKSLILPYRREISFEENINLWRAYVDVRHPEISHKIARAREDAFNTKYGDYNYELDLRKKYIEDWFQPIITLLKTEGFKKTSAFKVLGVGSNSGLELMQIFKGYNRVQLSVLELSSEAVRRGKEKYTHIEYHVGNMEDCIIERSSIDVYINLRSIHSTGVDLNKTLAECYKVLKPNGVAIISVSNGYLTPNILRQNEFVETKGIYDEITGVFSSNIPYEIACKIQNKMDKYGFRSIEVHTGKTEIFIKAIR